MTRFRLLLRAAAALAPMLVLIAGCAGAPDSGPARLTVIHVNDTHQHMLPFSTDADPRVRGGIARLATVVNGVRGGASPVLLLHGGDSLVGSAGDYLRNGKPDYQRLPTYGYRGLESVEVMSQLGFDAMVIGNHELDYGRRWLEELIGRAGFPIISANVMRRDVPDVQGASGGNLTRPYVIVRKGGLKIGIIGVTTVDYIQSLQVQVVDPTPVAARLVPEVAKQCDFVIVLSHLGLKPDLELARTVPEIDLIVGGHSHTLVPEPMMVGATMVVQAGSYLNQAGILDLSIQGGGIQSYTYRMQPLDQTVAPDPAVDATLRRYLAIGSVGDRPLKAAAFERNDVAALATSAMLAATDAEAALAPTDKFLTPLGPGSPSVEQFFNAFWPYHPRSQMPEKDMSEAQLLSTMGKPLDRALRTLVRASDGLRTLAIVTVPSQSFAEWARLNETRAGDPDFVQVDFREGAAPAAGQSRTLVTTLDLVLRLERLGLQIDPAGVRTTDRELFEVVREHLAARGASAAGR